MPLPFVFSSANMFGIAYTKMRGLVLAGSWTASTAATGPNPVPSGLAVIQPGAACSTLGVTAQIVSTSTAATPLASYVYIPQTTGPIFNSATTALAIAPPFSGAGAALLWDAANKRLNVWSSVHEWVAQLSSVGGGYFSSS